jgi:hypothetical protein
MDNFTPIWARIAANAGSEFRQKTGRQFTYSLVGNAIVPSTTNRMLARTQFQKAYQRSPLHGPGQLQDLQGPSYLFAILTDKRVATISSSVPVPTSVRASPRPAALLEDPWRPGRSSVSVSLAVPADQATGTRVGATALAAMGFLPLKLHITKREVQLGDAVGCEWTTIGEVPDAPGLYAFTLQRQDPEELRVVYVGMTTHLWMVTKGFLPRGGGARGGQRYGRPIHAGTTRQRVNVHIAEAIREGWTVQHWVKPFDGLSLGADPKQTLLTAEAKLIQRWALRREGWNRG